MEWQIQVRVNENLYIRNPELSQLGRNILVQGVILLEEMGLEDFTFKKLAARLSTNESSIYRYFESKHRLLLYLFQWYWRWMEYLLVFRTQNIQQVNEKVDVLVQVLMLKGVNLDTQEEAFDKLKLHQIMVRESLKAYLTKHVVVDNSQQFFKPYKDFVARVSLILQEARPGYSFSKSLASTLIEASHQQYFFMHHLPSLTDFGESKSEEELYQFLKNLATGN